MIGRDLRHAQLELMTGGPATERLFGAWSMCARAITPASAPILRAIDLAGAFEPFRLSGDKALQLLVAISKAPSEALKTAG